MGIEVGTRRYGVSYDTPELYVCTATVVYIHDMGRGLLVYITEEWDNSSDGSVGRHYGEPQLLKLYPYATREDAEAYIDSPEARESLYQAEAARSVA